MRRYKWSGVLIQRVYRLVQPRFTIGVVGVLLDDAAEHVLLVEHLLHTHKPWGLPGGWIDRGEDPARTAAREIYEETGLRVHVVQPLMVQRTPDMRAHMDVAYLCKLDGGDQDIRLCSELLGYCWTPCDELPPLVGLQAEAIALAVRAARHTLPEES